MNFPFSFWKQDISGVSYTFQDYSNPSNFSTCQNTIINLITAQSATITGADTKKVLKFIINRLTTVTDVLNTNSWSPYGSTSIFYDLTYPTKDPNPVVPTSHNTVTFEVKKDSNNSLVANGIIIFLNNNASGESYIQIDFTISQVI